MIIIIIIITTVRQDGGGDTDSITEIIVNKVLKILLFYLATRGEEF